MDVRRPFTVKGCNALGQLRFDSDGGDPTKVGVFLDYTLRWSPEDEVVPRRLLLEHLVDRLPIIPSRRAKQLNLQIAVDRREQDDEHSMIPAAA